jgi:hypothetical protein
MNKQKSPSYFESCDYDVWSSYVEREGHKGRVPQCMSPRRNWNSPTTLSPASVPLPPELGGGGTLACGLGESQFPIPTTLEKKLGTLPTLWVRHSGTGHLLLKCGFCDRLKVQMKKSTLLGCTMANGNGLVASSCWCWQTLGSKVYGLA